MELEPRSQQALAAEIAQRGAGNLESIWLDYLANGGNADFAEFHGYLHCAIVMPPFERRALEHTLWELSHFPADGSGYQALPAALPSRSFAGAPSLLAGLVSRSVTGQPLIGKAAVREAAVLIRRVGHEQLDRIVARPHLRHRRYVGW